MEKGLEEVFFRDELLQLTKDLIAINSSTDSADREKHVAAYLLSLFWQEGIEAYLQDIEDGRGNVIAILPGDGTKKSLMLNGHMDTVPVTGMEDPFGGQVRDGCLWGRGAADMKSGLAAMAYALILLKRMDIRLGGDVVFAGVIDEEAAKSTGSRYIALHGPKTDYAIVGEPTGLCPIVAHKGIDYFEIRFRGRAAHSSQPERGVNALYAAAEYILMVRDRLVPRYEQMRHPLTGVPTVNVGLVQGSAAANQGFLKGEAETFAGIVPDECSVWVDIRWTPYQTIAGIQKELEELAELVKEGMPEIVAEVHYIELPRPAMEIEAQDPLTKAVQKQVAAYDETRAELAGVSYFADSGILKGIGGISSMILGPGDIAVAHAADEHVEIEQIYQAARIYAAAAAEICGRKKEGIL